MLELGLGLKIGYICIIVNLGKSEGKNTFVDLPVSEELRRKSAHEEPTHQVRLTATERAVQNSDIPLCQFLDT